MKTVEMTRGYLEYYLNLIDKAGAGLGKISSSFQRSPAVGEMPPNSIAWDTEIVCGEKGQSIWQTSL